MPNFFFSPITYIYHYNITLLEIIIVINILWIFFPPNYGKILSNQNMRTVFNKRTPAEK